MYAFKVLVVSHSDVELAWQCVVPRLLEFVWCCVNYPHWSLAGELLYPKSRSFLNCVFFSECIRFSLDCVPFAVIFFYSPVNCYSFCITWRPCALKLLPFSFISRPFPLKSLLFYFSLAQALPDCTLTLNAGLLL